MPKIIVSESQYNRLLLNSANPTIKIVVTENQYDKLILGEQDDLTPRIQGSPTDTSDDYEATRQMKMGRDSIDMEPTPEDQQIRSDAKILADDIGAVFSIVYANEMKDYYNIIKKWVDRGKICQLMDHYNNTESLTDTLVDDVDEISFSTDRQKKEGNKWKNMALDILYDAEDECQGWWRDDEEEKKKCYDKKGKEIPCPPDLTLPVDQDSHILRNIKNRQIWPRFPGSHNACCKKNMIDKCNNDKRLGIDWIASCITRKGKVWDDLNPMIQHGSWGVGEWDKDDVEKCWCVPRGAIKEYKGEFNVAQQGNEPRIEKMSYWRYSSKYGPANIHDIDPLKFADYRGMTQIGQSVGPYQKPGLRDPRSQEKIEQEWEYGKRIENIKMIQMGTPDTATTKWMFKHRHEILDVLAIAAILIPYAGMFISTAIDLAHAKIYYDEGEKLIALIYVLLPIGFPAASGVIAKTWKGQGSKSVSKAFLKYGEIVGKKTKNRLYPHMAPSPTIVSGAKKEAMKLLTTDSEKAAFEWILKNPKTVKNQLKKEGIWKPEKVNAVSKVFKNQTKAFDQLKQPLKNQYSQYIKAHYKDYFLGKIPVKTRAAIVAGGLGLLYWLHTRANREQLAEEMVEVNIKDIIPPAYKEKVTKKTIGWIESMLKIPDITEKEGAEMIDSLGGIIKAIDSFDLTKMKSDTMDILLSFPAPEVSQNVDIYRKEVDTLGKALKKLAVELQDSAGNYSEEAAERLANEEIKALYKEMGWE